MKKSVLLSITLLIFILLTSCNIKEEVDPGDFVSYENGTEIKDIDGNIYHTINIGSQVWLVENLKTTRFQNGYTITNSTTNKNLSCYCVYNSDTTLGNIYGNLYNSNAVSDKRNICPKGWCIPSERDIKILINHLLNTSGVGNVLKESGAGHWGAEKSLIQSGYQR